MVLRLERQHFFDGATSWNVPLYLLVKVNSIAYIASGSTSEANRLTDQWERDEGTAVSRRDFTGHDFTAWVYDLFRPDEPYTARGMHPSGVGLRRYIRESDLTDAERAYLHRQGRLAMLNLLDPNLVSVSGGRFNAAAAHVLTPFGYTIDLNSFIHPKLFVALHDYVNHERSFPSARGSRSRRAMATACTSAFSRPWRAVGRVGERARAPAEIFRGSRGEECRVGGGECSPRPQHHTPYRSRNTRK